MKNPESIIKLPYQQLAISASMKRFMHLHGFETLEAMLQIKFYELLKMKGFNERSLKELYQFLEVHELKEMLKD